jgi:serine/threonine protein phosphatase PrpC
MSVDRELRVKASATFLHAGQRPGQEDHAMVLEDKRIFIVADGFGGPVPGAAASKTACESVQSFLYKEAGDLDATLPFELRSYFSLAGNVLFNALIHANRKVKKLNKDKDVHEKGGASVLAGYMDGSLLAIASVGACSAWLIRGGEARELVMPRTFARLRDPFHPDELADFQVPLMAVGISDDLEPEIFEYHMQPGDWLLLQTDGLTTSAREAVTTLQALGIASHRDPKELVAEAIEMLKRGEYQDNAAASLIVF